MASLDTAPPAVALVLAPDLDDDTRQFHARMTSDISTLAMHIGSSSYGNAAAQSLWETLTAPPAARTASWRRLYVQLLSLGAACAAHAPAADVREEFAQALKRLEQFLRENADLLDTTGVHEEPTAIGRAALA
jgi:hypothetical protein